MKQNINALNNLIARVINMLEKELDKIEANQSTSSTTHKKNIIMIGKLVKLVAELNELSEKEALSEEEMSASDKQIIDDFLATYGNPESRNNYTFAGTDK